MIGELLYYKKYSEATNNLDLYLSKLVSYSRLNICCDCDMHSYRTGPLGRGQYSLSLMSLISRLSFIHKSGTLSGCGDPLKP